MVPKKIIVGLVGMSFAALLPMSAMAQPLGTVEGLPFFGHPFPYGFAYHPQRDECYAACDRHARGSAGPGSLCLWRAGHSTLLTTSGLLSAPGSSMRARTGILYRRSAGTGGAT